MKQGALAIFVKTPGYSPVKTRLANDLGKVSAESFHFNSAKTVAAVARQTMTTNHLDCYFAVAEQAALQNHYWRQLPNVWQGEGGLGERMERVYRALLVDHAFVILIGADSPQITVEQLTEACKCMNQAYGKHNDVWAKFRWWFLAVRWELRYSTAKLDNS